MKFSKQTFNCETTAPPIPLTREVLASIFELSRLSQLTVFTICNLGSAPVRHHLFVLLFCLIVKKLPNLFRSRYKKELPITTHSFERKVCLSNSFLGWSQKNQRQMLQEKNCRQGKLASSKVCFPSAQQQDKREVPKVGQKIFLFGWQTLGCR